MPTSVSKLGVNGYNSLRRGKVILIWPPNQSDALLLALQPKSTWRQQLLRCTDRAHAACAPRASASATRPAGDDVQHRLGESHGPYSYATQPRHVMGVPCPYRTPGRCAVLVSVRPGSGPGGEHARSRIPLIRRVRSVGCCQRQGRSLVCGHRGRYRTRRAQCGGRGGHKAQRTSLARSPPPPARTAARHARTRLWDHDVAWPAVPAALP